MTSFAYGQYGFSSEIPYQLYCLHHTGNHDNNIGPRMADSIYHLTTLKSHFLDARFCHYVRNVVMDVYIQLKHSFESKVKRKYHP